MDRVGFTIGVLLGAAAGLFLTPGRGAEIRARLREAGQELAARGAETRAAGSSPRVRPDYYTVGPCAPTL